MYIDGKTKVYGILGWPVSHSLSPLLHNTAFRSCCKINSVYLPFPVEKPRNSTKEAFLELGIYGLSVTIPHKKWAAEIAVKKDELSECCGAANTLIRKGEEWHAFNTDGKGALQAMQKKIGNLKGKNFLIIGYGGSAAAIAHSLLMEQVPNCLLITGRNMQKRERFASSLLEKHPASGSAVREGPCKDLNPQEIDVIIQATPLGMQGAPQELPIPENFIQKKHFVFDIVYHPTRTPFLQNARRKGAKIIPGYLMLLYQAVLQFELFTGQKAPSKIMERVLRRALK